jgi:hypothetical protein
MDGASAQPHGFEAPPGTRCHRHVPPVDVPVTGEQISQRTTKYVALDGHRATTLASVREDSDRVIPWSILPASRPALTEFFQGMRGPIHVALAEATQAHWVHDLLVPLVDRVVVCDRRGEVRSGGKVDQVDADSCRSGPAGGTCARCITRAGRAPCSRSSRAVTRTRSRTRRG